MRTYILTHKEREILANYLGHNRKLDGFSVLTLRLRKAEKILESDWQMIEATLKKLQKEGSD